MTASQLPLDSHITIDSGIAQSSNQSPTSCCAWRAEIRSRRSTSEVQRLERISARQAADEVADWMGDWAIPEQIVMCESGGNWDAVNPSSGAGGAYQILPSTWDLYGGDGDPQDASPAEQSDIAAQIWADSGSAAWVCAG